MDQVYAMEDVKQQGARAQERERHRAIGDAAVQRGEAALREAALKGAQLVEAPIYQHTDIPIY